MMYFEHRLRQSHRFLTNKQPNVHGSTWSTRYLNCQTILSNSLAYSSMCWIILYAGISCFASLSVSVSKQQKLSCFKSHPRWGKKMESGRKFSTPQQQSREKDKTQLLLTFSAKDFISFSLSKYRILAASEKDIQQYAFSAQAAISSLKKETMAKNIRTEERNYF